MTPGGIIALLTALVVVGKVITLLRMAITAMALAPFSGYLLEAEEGWFTEPPKRSPRAGWPSSCGSGCRSSSLALPPASVARWKAFWWLNRLSPSLGIALAERTFRTNLKRLRTWQER